MEKGAFDKLKYFCVSTLECSAQGWDSLSLKLYWQTTHEISANREKYHIIAWWISTQSLKLDCTLDCNSFSTRQRLIFFVLYPSYAWVLKGQFDDEMFVYFGVIRSQLRKNWLLNT